MSGNADDQPKRRSRLSRMGNLLKQALLALAGGIGLMVAIVAVTRLAIGVSRYLHARGWTATAPSEPVVGAAVFVLLLLVGLLVRRWLRRMKAAPPPRERRREGWLWTAWRFVSDLVYILLLSVGYLWGAGVSFGVVMLTFLAVEHAPPAVTFVAMPLAGVVAVAFFCLLGLALGYHAADRIGGGVLMGLALAAVASAYLFVGTSHLEPVYTASYMAGVALMLAISAVPTVLGALLHDHPVRRLARFRTWLARQAHGLRALPRVVAVVLVLGALLHLGEYLMRSARVPGQP